MINLQEILIAIRNGDYDHFDGGKVIQARIELKELLKCDDWELDSLLPALLMSEE